MKVSDWRLIAAFTVAYQSGRVIGAMDLGLLASATCAAVVLMVFYGCFLGGDE